jgi:hypothetical protein
MPMKVSEQINNAKTETETETGTGTCIVKVSDSTIETCS